MNPERDNEQAGSEISSLSAQIHAGTARLVNRTAECGRSGSWQGQGFRSLAHWLSVVSGYDWPTCAEIVRVGQALADLPLIQGEFASGSLSFDKIRSLTRVAKPEDQEMWLQVAQQASGSQLTRICRAFARAMDEKVDQNQQRAVSWWWRDDGMLALSALLSAEDGAVVIAAIEKLLPQPRAGEEIDTRRADAFVELCANPENRPLPRLVVHVDADRSYIEGGPSIANTTAQRLGCDTEVVNVTERDGSPLDVGRARRLVSGRLRYALQMRDATCRFPGCCVPASKTHAHHIQHWFEGGKTNLSNLVSLCGFHHRRLHNGEFQIHSDGLGIRFETAHGSPLCPAVQALLPPNFGDMPSPLAQSGGEPIADFGYAISVLCEGANFASSRASP